MRGPKLLAAAVNQILAHPETWDQGSWHCGTTHCIAGHCQMLAGDGEADTYIRARDLLGLSDWEAAYLFAAWRTLSEIYHFAEKYIGGSDGYDRGGFYRDGYNRDGYNRAGYDHAGYNRSGYNHDGYNRDGHQVELVPFDLDSIREGV